MLGVRKSTTAIPRDIKDALTEPVREPSPLNAWTTRETEGKTPQQAEGVEQGDFRELNDTCNIRNGRASGKPAKIQRGSGLGDCCFKSLGQYHASTKGLTPERNKLAYLSISKCYALRYMVRVRIELSIASGPLLLYPRLASSFMKPESPRFLGRADHNIAVTCEVAP